MPVTSCCRLAVGAAAVFVVVSHAPAQGAPAAPVPCRDSMCRVVFDWGGGQTSAPMDRRYGSGDDFEAKVRSALTAKQYRMTEETKPGEIVIALRPRMKSAICDAMPGLNTDLSCKTIGDLAIAFSGGDATLKPPGARSVRNSCGDATMMMTMAQFGQYTGDMIAYFMEGEKKGERRPSLKC